MLSEDSSDSEVDDNPVHQLTINEHYAKAYAYKKEREELAKRALSEFNDCRLHCSNSIAFQ